MDDKFNIIGNEEILEAVARIAGQIAHDINNFLTPLLAYPSLIKQELPENSMSIELLETMEEATQHILRITKGLLLLSARNIHDGLAETMLGVAIQAALQKVDILLKEKNITVLVEHNPDINTVMAQLEGLIIVFELLFMNSIEAMKEGGVITVKIDKVKISEERITVGNKKMPPGEYVVVTIGDTGTGIDPEILPRVFEPFVSTKRAKGIRGAGLGLTVVYRLVRLFNGFIELYSSSEGTRVIIYLIPV